MPAKARDITAADDEVIRGMRGTGARWETIAHRLHIHHRRLRAHAVATLGLPAHLPGSKTAPSTDPAVIARRARNAARRAQADRRRELREDAGDSLGFMAARLPLPAGHPITWGAIAAGAWPQPESLGR